MKFNTEIENAAYKLAMMGIQSERYMGDGEYKDAVDAVLNLTLMNDKNKKPDMHDVRSDSRRTIESDLAEDR